MPRKPKTDTDLIGTRVDPATRQLVEASAALEGLSVAAWLRRIVLANVRDLTPEDLHAPTPARYEEDPA